MKQTTFQKKFIAVLSASVIAASCPIVSMAVEDSGSGISQSESSDHTSRMTSDDWAELQSQAEAELSSQNAEQSKKSSEKSDKNDNNGAFKDFKEGKYIGNGEWLLVIGIILILLGIAGIGFIVFMMLRRKKLSMTAQNGKNKYPRGSRSASSQNNNGTSSQRRIAPKNNGGR